MALSLNLHNNSISKAYPFPHLTKQGLWLVPVRKKDEKATFYIGHNKTKTYIIKDSDSYNSVNVNGETYLPLIHLLIANLKSGSAEFLQDELLHSVAFLLIPPGGDTDNEIGWRVSESWYTLVIKEEILNHLRGDPIDKEKYELLPEFKSNLKNFINELKD